jgi:hypothetical protein
MGPQLLDAHSLPIGPNQLAALILHSLFAQPTAHDGLCRRKSPKTAFPRFFLKASCHKPKPIRPFRTLPKPHFHLPTTLPAR